MNREGYSDNHTGPGARGKIVCVQIGVHRWKHGHLYDVDIIRTSANPDADYAVSHFSTRDHAEGERLLKKGRHMQCILAKQIREREEAEDVSKSS